MHVRKVWFSLLAATAAGCTAHGGTLLFLFKDDKGVPLADVVVAARAPGSASDTPRSAPAAGRVEIEQRDQEFSPYVTVVPVGQEVGFPNHDTVQHHVYSLSKPKRFEIPLFGQNDKGGVLFDAPGVVTIGCNIHDWMIAYVLVSDTPWHSQSDADGRARLPDLPAGKMQIEAWHPRLPRLLKWEAVVPPEGVHAEQVMVLKLKPQRAGATDADKTRRRRY